MSKFAKNLLRKDVHYLQNANPYKTIESLNSLLDNNLSLCENNNYAILNKPPGFALLGLYTIQTSFSIMSFHMIYSI